MEWEEGDTEGNDNVDVKIGLSGRVRERMRVSVTMRIMVMASVQPIQKHPNEIPNPLVTATRTI